MGTIVKQITVTVEDVPQIIKQISINSEPQTPIIKQISVISQDMVTISKSITVVVRPDSLIDGYKDTAQYRVCRQHNREQYVRISIIDKNDNIIGNIEGKTIDGSISITNDSYLRRTCSLRLILDKELLPSQSSYIWMNKKFKLEIGILDLLTGEIVWFNQGIYLYEKVNMSYSATDKTLQITANDKMCNLNGLLGGTLEDDVEIPIDVPISEAIRSVVTQLGGESVNNLLIEDIVDDNNNSRVTPYKISKNAGDNVLEILKTLIELYKYNTLYYDTDGHFVSEKTKTLLNDPVVEDFRDLDFTITSQVSQDFSYIKNYVKVMGTTIEPLVGVEDKQTVNNTTPINNSTKLKVTYNKPLYDSTFTRIADGTDITSYFIYSGTNYTSAIYDNDDYSVTFTITGENGKIIKARENMIFDSHQLAFRDGGFVYSSKDATWSSELKASLITDGVNDDVQFKLYFNKPLYSQSGTAIATGTSLKSSFTYVDGENPSDQTNFIDAIYTIDSTEYYVTLTFNSGVINSVIEINKNGTNNQYSVYDSANIVYKTQNYIMTGDTWTLVSSEDTSNYQISATASNTDNTSPYSIDNIGKKVYIPSSTNSTIFTKDQAQLEAQYQLEMHSNLNESISLSCLSLYYLDVNKIFYLESEPTNTSGKYCINSISYNLKDGTMNIGCNKVYI